MDEILASIRKIIENNEDEGFAITTESHASLMDHPAVVDRFHSEEQRAAVPPFQRSEPGQGGQPALSLADVAARVRAASERHVAANRESAEPVAIEPEPREESPLVIAGLTEMSRPVPTEKVEPVMEETVTVEPVPAIAEPAAPGRDVAALVSPAVGERVAQSFGALAEALDAGPRRSFDEIAEDMLRPMLQEWLDDNLPTLVERLVREEIERVARGPRR
jgi:cell pole-organizing protein PopZ